MGAHYFFTMNIYSPIDLHLKFGMPTIQKTAKLSEILGHQS